MRRANCFGLVAVRRALLLEPYISSAVDVYCGERSFMPLPVCRNYVLEIIVLYLTIILRTIGIRLERRTIVTREQLNVPCFFTKPVFITLAIRPRRSPVTASVIFLFSINEQVDLYAWKIERFLLEVR